MLYTQTVAPRTLELLKKLEAEPSLAAFNLAGGDLPSLQKTSVDGLSILDAFLEIGFVASKGEARRLIKQSGLKLNDKVISDENYVLSASDVVDGQVKLSQGKKKHGLIKVA